MKRKTKRRVRPVVGVLDPERLYTTDAAMRYAGLGSEQLAVARRDGVPHYERGNRVYYLGRDLIGWITGNQARQPITSGKTRHA